jgi:uncharacterized repeat protein (TIGR02543 family)
MLEGAVVIWILFGIISMVAAQKKGRSGCGWFLLGVLLGPFGFILALLSDPIDEPQKHQSQDMQNDSTPSYVVVPEPKLIDVTPSGSAIQNYSEKVIKTFDYTDKVVFEWPVEMESGQIISHNDTNNELKATFVVTNISSKEIKYMEWHIHCFDMLRKVISVDQPVIIRSEMPIKVKSNAIIEQTGSLPQDTKYFLPYLRAVVFEDDEIIEYPEGLIESDASAKNEIEQVEDVDYYCITAFRQRNNPQKEPRFLFISHPTGVWTCVYCGTRNKKDDGACRCCSASIDGQEEYSKAELDSYSLTWEIEKRQKEEQRKAEYERQEQERREAEEQLRLRNKLQLQEEKDRQAERNKKILKFSLFGLISLILLAGLSFVLWKGVLENQYLYKQASITYKDQQFYESYKKFSALGNFKDSKQQSFSSYRKYLESISNIGTMIAGYQWLLENGDSSANVYDSFEATLSKVTSKEDLLLGWSWLISVGYPEAKEKLYFISNEAIKEKDYLYAFELFSSLTDYKDAPSKSMEAYRYYLASVNDIDLQIKGYEWLLDIGDTGANIYESFSDVLRAIPDITTRLKGWQWLYSKGFADTKEALYSITQEAWSKGNYTLAYSGYDSLKEDDEYRQRIADEFKVPVALELNGGEGLPELIQVGLGNPIGLSTLPHKSGYVFDGWYRESTLQNLWDMNLNTITDRTTVFAKWRDYRIGDKGPAGGIIFHDKGNSNAGWRYLEVASEDLGRAPFGYYRPDGNESKEVGTREELGEGKNNTILLTSTMTSTAYKGLSGADITSQYVANICSEYSIEENGTRYDDWFLPSIGELGALYEALRDSLGMSGNYWSSTEYFDLNAWYLNFSNGEQNNINRSFLYKVRPVRSFAPPPVSLKSQNNNIETQPPIVKQDTPTLKPSEVIKEVYLGNWKDNDWDADVVIYMKDKNRLSMTYSFSDGSKVVDDYYIQQISNWKAVLKPFEDDFGEYYTLDLKTSELKLYDGDGWASTLRIIRKVPLETLIH